MISNNQPVGIPFQNPLRSLGPRQDVIPIKRFPRRPLPTDRKYRIGQFVILGKNPSTGVDGELWYLSRFDSSGGALWLPVDSIRSLETDDGAPAVHPTLDGVAGIKGGLGITTSGQDPDTDVVVAVDGDVVTTTYETDRFNATPINGLLKVLGGRAMYTYENLTNEIVLDSKLQFITDEGVSTLVPIDGRFTVAGGLGIKTKSEAPTTQMVVSVDDPVTTEFVTDDGSVAALGGITNVVGVNGTSTRASSPNTIEVFSSGGVLQMVHASTSDLIEISTTIPIDDTIPQITEGQQVLAVTITPKSVTSTLHVFFNGNIVTFGNDGSQALFQDEIPDALAAMALPNYSTGSLNWFGLSGSLAPRTFKIRLGHDPVIGNNIYLNGSQPSRVFGGVSSTVLYVTETEN